MQTHVTHLLILYDLMTYSGLENILSFYEERVKQFWKSSLNIGDFSFRAFGQACAFEQKFIFWIFSLLTYFHIAKLGNPEPDEICCLFTTSNPGQIHMYNYRPNFLEVDFVFIKNQPNFFLFWWSWPWTTDTRRLNP